MRIKICERFQQNISDSTKSRKFLINLFWIESDFNFLQELQDRNSRHKNISINNFSFKIFNILLETESHQFKIH